MKKNAIISLADSSYYELLIELINSIKRFKNSSDVSICVLNAGLTEDQVNNISSVVSSNGIITDFTGPAGTWVFDGDSVDIDRQNYTDSYQSHWKQFDEQGSGFLTYEYALSKVSASKNLSPFMLGLKIIFHLLFR